ncbi:MAG: hypothetical protein LAN84_15590 [Acidobacteriia bacterium]|nr:hypothetical protein [Terriglobia bacterium]
MDPLHALADLIVGWHRTGKMVQFADNFRRWAAGLVGLTISYVLGYSGGKGGALLAGKPEAIATGIGLLTAGGMMLASFLRSGKMFRDVVVATPQNLIPAQIDDKGRGPMVSHAEDSQK